MALQQNFYSSKFDTLFYNAYWRINPNDGIIGGKNKVVYTIEVFKNAGMAHVEIPVPMDKLTFEFVPNINGGADNFIAQAYLHAKTLPYFSGSVDV